MTSAHHPARRRAALALTAALLLPPAAAAAQSAEPAVVLAAAEGHTRRALAATPRDQLALVLYGLLGLATVAGFGTLRRQLRGEREQSDGEFRWR
jgi:hypothetical protein